MRDRYIPALVMLIAGMITCIMDIYNKVELIKSLKRLLFVLIIFYIIGRIARWVLIKIYRMNAEKEQEAAQDEADTEIANEAE